MTLDDIDQAVLKALRPMPGVVTSFSIESGADLAPASFDGYTIYASPMGVDVLLPPDVVVTDSSGRLLSDGHINPGRRYFVWGGPRGKAVAQ